ncbi:MAG: hypothetical protein WD533_07515, partial [Dehalococcoidia bacterium]
ALVVGLSAIAALVMGPALWDTDDDLQGRWRLISLPGEPTPSLPSISWQGAEAGTPTWNVAISDLGPARVTIQATMAEIDESDFTSDGAAYDNLVIRMQSESQPTSCQEQEAHEVLRESEIAFDGTVERTGLESDEPQVLFSVNRWYRGGDSQTVLAEIDSGAGVIKPILEGRWLVAGQDSGAEPAEACGLLQGYSEQRAREWEEALAP